MKTGMGQVLAYGEGRVAAERWGTTAEPDWGSYGETGLQSYRMPSHLNRFAMTSLAWHPGAGRSGAYDTDISWVYGAILERPVRYSGREGLVAYETAGWSTSHKGGADQ